MTIINKKDQHLFVLIHGLWGNYKHMDSLKQIFKSYFKNDQIVIFTPAENAKFKTIDGIELVGYRTLIELCQFIKSYYNLNPNSRFTKISFLGYSMGGLVSRFVIGKMQNECYEFFKDIEPYLFITMATPHIGVNFYNPTSIVKIILYSFLKFLGSNVLGKSGHELFISDGNLNKEPILVQLSKGDYLKGLERFKYRIAMANTKNDRTVAFYTSFITNVDPFIQYNHTLKFQYESHPPGKYDKFHSLPRILDMDKLDPKLLYSPFIKISNLNDDYASIALHYWKWIYMIPMLIFIICVILPIAFVLNLSATIYSYIINYKYAKMLRDGDLPNLVQNKISNTDKLKDLVVDTYSTITISNTGTIVNEEEEEEEEECTETSSLSSNELHLDSTHHTDDSEWLNFISKYSNNWKNPNSEKFTKLPFDNNRLVILKNLNTLSWIRIPVYVKSVNAHAGIVARRGLDNHTAKTSYASLQFTSQLLDFLFKRCDDYTSISDDIV
ncbi:hypothetical protein TBLA_0A06220 [Henningerozyma blattae CBS 6284]|uniref:DUF676 domain-containing protein n=1 Tax=Henningerozyma blattae (strain ATCC 34711 / CBS 6284 / DSM 70876 / NBRC 10599 / NRRL Y-10934 / UCD 77-7) TaxID=1071380 RepID=I2GWB2_HENB6|nr:hypothetical protein TBLA_0A06220 [Tetrapisispora blattae CBS 6284]CCH58414.1 hypothetical protein TBLA_0A06220 [Tetrapisispora blattae CBS 6284]